MILKKNNQFFHKFGSKNSIIKTYLILVLINFYLFSIHRWTYNVLKKGRKKPYEIEDLPNAPQCDNAHVLGNKLD